MDYLNNSEDEVFQNTLEKQKKFISTRFSTIKSNRYLNDNMLCLGSKEEIATHLNQGPAQNLVQTFFNYRTKECIHCKKCKGTNGILQFERAHCNKYNRYDLLMLALDDLYIDSKTPIKVSDILKLFIEKHSLCPIYMLCNICHKRYDTHRSVTKN